MEQVRLLIAVALSLLVFIVWQVFFPAEKPEQTKAPVQNIEQQKEVETKDTASVPEKKPDIQTTVAQEDKEAGEVTREPRSILVSTPLYKIRISEKGAVFKSITLQRYKKELDKNSEPYEIISPQVKTGTLLAGFEKSSIRGLEEKVFTVDAPYDDVGVESGMREVVFSYTSRNGIRVEKKYTFNPNSYVIGMEVTVKNGSSTPIQDSIALSLINASSDKKRMYGFEGPSGMIGNSLEEVKTTKIEDNNLFSGDLKWVAIQDRYFISCIIPTAPGDATMKLGFDKDTGVVRNRYVTKEAVIEPGAEQLFEYELYFGPKSITELKKVGYNLDRAVNFGFFDFLAKPCLWMMNKLYTIIPNYGIAIIILTIFTKILLWPLGTKSYKSMNEMKKLQPLMADIRAKHKDDKKKMNEELMGLYKTYKINPLGGCLPMVVQIPVFFALYRMLYGAVELRHAPFFGWINDLSAPDRLFDFHFSFKVPFMEPPYGIPVLTIIMGASMLISQKMQPPAGDPAQAKMMMLLPVVFTVIFVNFSSGLVLYWLINNILSVAQQYYIQKKYA